MASFSAYKFRFYHLLMSNVTLSKISLSACVFTALLAGCASSSLSTDSAIPVPSDRVYLRSTPERSTVSTIVFVKDNGLFASLAYTQILLNGQLAASIKGGERFTTQVTPGEHVFAILPSASKDKVREGFGEFSMKSVDITVQTGKTYYYRIRLDEEAQSHIQRFVPSSGG